MASGDEVHLIHIFEHEHPWPGQEICHGGERWLVTEVVQISGQWVAWGHTVATPDEGSAGS